MDSYELRPLLPIPHPIVEVLQAHQLSHEFYREVRHREALDAYCAWYDAIAAEHQRELTKMHQDFNLLGWFYRGWNRRHH